MACTYNVIPCLLTIKFIIRMKSLDPLRTKKTDIRMKQDVPDCTVSSN